MLNKSKLGFNATWSMAVGGMIGGGIFSTLGVVVGIAGVWAWLSFAVAGLIALAAGYSYVKLATHYRRMRTRVLSRRRRAGYYRIWCAGRSHCFSCSYRSVDRNRPAGACFSRLASDRRFVRAADTATPHQNRNPSSLSWKRAAPCFAERSSVGALSYRRGHARGAGCRIVQERRR